MFVAHELGITHRELRTSMSTVEFINWLAFHELKVEERKAAVARAKSERDGWGSRGIRR